ncbi:MAG TPA: enoyl-CoA hydratase-related protein [Bdellovibrionota bacterium]|jgi:methylglutaconyl-CoA hydratase|nr:enoyl-CoA hydratase-related protein [Bdellovibrionota bacterium]
MASYQTLQVTRTGPVLTVALNRPDVRNAFNDVVIDELDAVFGKDALDPAVRAVVLKGNGPVFCAGGDLNWMKKAVGFSYDENLRDTRTLAKMFDRVNAFPKPLVGLVHGAAIGGAVGLVSVCDIVIASSETLFSLSEVRLGIVPACIGPFVVAKIGASHARALFLSADRVPAARAKEIGLVHEVVASPAELEAAGKRVIENIVQCGPGALATAKKLVLDLSWPERRMKQPDCLEYVAKMLADIRVSEEGQEGVKAFLEKRKPSWLKG